MVQFFPVDILRYGIKRSELLSLEFLKEHSFSRKSKLKLTAKKVKRKSDV